MLSLAIGPAHALVLPSVRLKNLRRGAQDLGWLRLAREHNPDATDEVVRSMIPRALHDMKDEPATWPARGTNWLEARHRLLEILDGPARPAAPKKPEAPREAASARPGCAGMSTLGALAVLAALAFARGILKSRRNRPS
jgi:hypothetical protein